MKKLLFSWQQKTGRGGLKLRTTPASAWFCSWWADTPPVVMAEFLSLNLLRVLSASQTAPDWIRWFKSYLYFGLHNFLAHNRSEARAWIGLSCPTAFLPVIVPFKMQLKNGVNWEQAWNKGEVLQKRQEMAVELKSLQHATKRIPKKINYIS